MADAAARREARRRRILENSESRLQRITGQSNSADVTPGESAKRPQKSEILSPVINGTIPNESLIDSWNIPSEFQEDFPSTSQSNIFSESTINSQSNVPRRRNFGYIPNGDIQGHVHDDDRFDANSSNTFFEYAETNTRSSVDSEKIKSSTLISFLGSRWIYIALAVIVNIMIVLNAEHLYGTSIIVPFALILISRMLFCEKPQDTQSGSMLFAALILCNIRPDIIYRLKASSALFFRILREFAFYLFSFILIYYFFTSYWYDFDELTPNKAEIVVDRQTEA